MKFWILLAVVALALGGLYITKAYSNQHLVCTTSLSMVNGKITKDRVTFLVNPDTKRLAIIDEWGRMNIDGETRTGPGDTIHIVSKAEPITYAFTLYRDTGEYMHRFTNETQKLSGVYIGKCTEAYSHDVYRIRTPQALRRLIKLWRLGGEIVDTGQRSIRCRSSTTRKAPRWKMFTSLLPEKVEASCLGFPVWA